MTGEAATPHALRLQGVGIRFGAIAAVDGVDLAVASGERRVILGSNGAGKTTLFNCIAGDIRASEGNIFLSGRDVTRMPTHLRVRDGLRRTYQTSLLFDGLTVLENLLVAVQGVRPGRFSLRRVSAEDVRRGEALELASRLGLANRLMTLVRELSHGQRRQLELGMALAGTARVILLDEPAAGLSANERASLVAMLEALPRSQTLLMIEHDIDIAMQIADRITVMHQGRVIAEGTPAEVAGDQSVLDIYLGRHGH